MWNSLGGREIRELSILKHKSFIMCLHFIIYFPFNALNRKYRLILIICNNEEGDVLVCEIKVMDICPVVKFILMDII